MKTPILQTPRLTLRPAEVSDAAAVYRNWTSDPDVAHFMRWNTHSSVDDTAQWLARAVANVEDKNSYDWLFICRETGEPIGSGGVFYSEKHSMWEIGYGLMKSRWGQGIVTEAATEMLKFATETLGHRQIFATHAVENAASGRILQKLGFVYTGDGSYGSFDGSRSFTAREYILNHTEGHNG
jgi:ribosomal-protein-alanine N-acetyltransferase